MYIKNAWYVAAWADDVTDAPLARRICGDSVVLFRDRRTKTPAALADFCVHRGAPLSAGRCVDAGIECGYHGMVYRGDGASVHIPGQVHIPAKARTRSYPLVEKDGCLWIWMGEPALADPATIIDYPFHNDPVNWPHKHTMYPIAGAAQLMVDNLMDLTHLPYVHPATIGGANATDHVEAIMDVEPRENGLKFTRWMLNHVPPPTYRKACPHLGETVDRWQEFEFLAPSVVLQWVGAIDANTGAYDQGKRDGGFSLRILHALTPETETTSHYFWCGSNGYAQHDPNATEVLFGELSFAFHEDQAIVQRQQERLLEFGEDRLINIVADGARVHMRRVMDKLIARERATQPLAAG
jgi:phenylpropionate dioxygenase-like ring-hydroxylating dioxygenase large terminal subunit